MLLGFSRHHHRSSGSSGSAGYRRSSPAGIWMHKSDGGRLHPRQAVPLTVPLVKDVVLYAVVERVCRIVARHGRGRRAAARDARRRDRKARTTRCSRRALQRRAGAHARRRRPRATDRRHRSLPDAAMQMMRVGEDTGTLDVQLDERRRVLRPRARVQAQEAHVALRTAGDHLHGRRSSASSPSRSSPRCTASSTIGALHRSSHAT